VDFGGSMHSIKPFSMLLGLEQMSSCGEMRGSGATRLHLLDGIRQLVYDLHSAIIPAQATKKEQAISALLFLG